MLYAIRGPRRVLSVIRHKISQSRLAATAGVARENVSRVMSDRKRNTTRGVGRRLTSRGRHPNKIGLRIDGQAVGASTATRSCVLRPRIISSIGQHSAFLQP